MRSLRVLHVLGGTDRGGIETWLLRLMPVLNAQGVHSDIVVDSSDQGDYHAPSIPARAPTIRGAMRHAWARSSPSMALMTSCTRSCICSMG
jgi:hypothetical protein